MTQILDFLIKFINDNHLDDGIEIIVVPNLENPEIEMITIKRIHAEVEK